ncbi:hypothetical protein JDV02_010368 [Purpureocillium takamizusanense]|uniref:Jacalin-type lectin domain-containing protein n=1 Tax=Purpureocillium takamizusanense TaxID=2060973 RepID=A0A9Q8VF51_9HYPO|nr:uncharacterized protein JDV02_010368 [Purpureocillium takamizusanense]UNI24635.1 hypothetical protein JDV02_010368 [Purpureocillium takamizusanense]
MPTHVQIALHREIFSGPWGRHTTYADWTEEKPFGIHQHDERITALYLRGWDDVDCVQIKYDDRWGYHYGSETGGAPQHLDLAKDEYVESIDVRYGHKLGMVKFVTNKEREVQVGKERHGFVWGTAERGGCELTSVNVTKYEAHTPPGCEGIIFGFRSRWTLPPLV